MIGAKRSRRIESSFLCTPAIASGALYVRSDGLRWTLIESMSLEAELSLPALNCALSLGVIYADVSFAADT